VAAGRQHLKAAAPHEEKAVPLPGAGSYDRPVPSPEVTPIGSLREPGKAAVEGRVRVVEVRSVERNSVLAAEISDSTGDLTALFYGRSRIPGLMCGSRVRLRGPAGFKNGGPVMVNPAYELLVPYTTGTSGDDG
jgi:RecG-like helicase